MNLSLSLLLPRLLVDLLGFRLISRPSFTSGSFNLPSTTVSLQVSFFNLLFPHESARVPISASSSSPTISSQSSKFGGFFGDSWLVCFRSLRNVWLFWFECLAFLVRLLEPDQLLVRFLIPTMVTAMQCPNFAFLFFFLGENFWVG